MLIRITSFILLCTIITSCGCKQNPNQTNTGSDTTKADSSLLTFLSPSNGDRANWGETVTITYKATKDDVKIDSSVLTINGERIAQQSNSLGYSWDVPQEAKVGNTNILLTVWHDGGKSTKLSTMVKVYPPAPTFYDYEVVNSYPHDIEAYTQGLFYHNGFLYESTGQNGKSTLRKVELKTGKVLKSVSLENEYFGEGCVWLNDKIYQLTWESRKGFVYDANTFERIGEFTYPTEGWGLATDGKYLIMGDGSSILRYMDPETFKEVKNIEVYTDKGALIWLNELEYVDGHIWANVYTMDTIVSIDPATGRVTKVVDLRGLLPEDLHTTSTDVLNGVAYDKNRNGNFYVTGKNWPKLYEIKLVQRKYEDQ